eukprot:CAMPEP_0118714380 /NCGR_PEP_ID=MMETSP0800-20121206/26155_1 /TAXON_ID=210618 ORGANISM="Striatella unipunctata, Strain CCMP2910" /NCGR_SAMPLE_ID=MMETSP0800 /ASSEMBLY_ACC=CAM_ASM_000638 /LENGTH=472 /DNA_ID=CAMNT_0006620167 /DNA_START=151 /DNA_END=1569 /DNA_ORIENTATION=-
MYQQLRKYDVDDQATTELTEVRTLEDASRQDLHELLLPNTEFDEQAHLSNDESRYTNMNIERYAILGPLATYILIFLLSGVLVFVPDISPSKLLDLALFMLGTAGAGSSFLGTAVLIFAGRFPPRIGVNSFLSGQVMGGFLVSLGGFLNEAVEDPMRFWTATCTNNFNTSISDLENMFFEKVVSHLEDEESLQALESPLECPHFEVDFATFSYFFIGLLTTVVAMAGYMILYSNRGSYTFEEETEMPLLETNEPSVVLSELSSEDSDSDSAAEMGGRTMEGKPSVSNSVIGALEVVRKPGIATFLSLFVTLTIFPAWMTKLKSVSMCESDTRIHNDLFVPMLLVLQNGCDLLGRLCGRWIKQDKIANLPSKLVRAAVARCFLLGLFLFCEAKGSAPHALVVHQDWYPVLLVIILGFSNGLIVSLSFMHVGSVSKTPSMKQTTSTLMLLALSLGLITGSVVAFPYSRLGLGHW